MNKVYDATVEYKGDKEKMPLYAAEELKRGDVVIVELMVARWVPTVQQDNNKPGKQDSSSSSTANASPPKAHSSPAKTKYSGKREWKKWVVDLRLRAISVLHVAPVDNMPYKEDEEFTV